MEKDNSLRSGVFEEDVVQCKKHKRIGIVIRTAKSDEDSDEEMSSDEEDEEKVVAGKVMVSWYNPNKWSEDDESIVVDEDSVSLVDRAILPGDVVRWVAQEKGNQKGFIKNVEVTVDVRIVGTTHVLKAKPFSLLLPIDNNLSNGMPILKGSWLGTIEGQNIELTLRLKNGSRCLITGEAVNDLYDVTDQRDSESHFYFDHFYPGQLVQGIARVFKDAKWITGNKPVCNNQGKVKAVVEKVDFTQLSVDWELLGDIGNMGEILNYGEHLEKKDFTADDFYVLTNYRDNNIQIGDKAFYVLTDEDVKVCNEKNSKKADTKPSKKEMETQNGGGDEESDSDEEQQEEEEKQEKVSEHENNDQNNQQQGPSGSQQQVSSSNLTTVTNQGPRQRSSSTRQRTRRRHVPLPKRKKKYKPTITLQAGEKVCVEVCCIATWSTVQWQDSSITKDVPSTSLYPVIHLDELEFFPGDFVLDKREEATSSKNQRCGVIQQADFNGRVCNVRWLDDVDSGNNPEENVSVYDMADHQDFAFRTGDIVLRLAKEMRPEECMERVVELKERHGISENSTKETGSIEEEKKGTEPESKKENGQKEENKGTEPELNKEDEQKGEKEQAETEKTEQSSNESMAPAGQVVEVNPDGSVHVMWVDGTSSDIVPARLYVYNKEDYGEDGSEGTFEDAGGSGEEGGWETEESDDEPSNNTDTSWNQPMDPIEDIIMRSLASFSNASNTDGNVIGLNQRTEDYLNELGRQFAVSAQENLPNQPLAESAEQGDGKEKEKLQEEEKVQEEARKKEEGNADQTSADKEQEKSTTLVSMEGSPEQHHYIDSLCTPSNPRTFNSAIMKDAKLLATHLPAGFLVKRFDERVDLLSVLIEGPVATPYEGALFYFDMHLPDTYPLVPPSVHYHSYCRDRLNPNLYEEGKVCISLLGTWVGRDNETWTSKSTIHQLLLSIQGLILCEEPYYNEAGYEKQRGAAEGVENSRLYNEMATLKTLQSVNAMLRRPPAVFKEEIHAHFKTNLPKMITRVEEWLTDSSTPCFPLFPITKGFCATAQRVIEQLKTIVL